MTRWHTRPARKSTGGLISRNMKKKRRQRGSEFLETKIGKARARVKRTLGGGVKMELLLAEYVNVSGPKGKAMKKAKIITVVENPANPHYVRRNIITRGAVVKTDMGKVRITSRPGQTGSLNGVLVEEKKIG